MTPPLNPDILRFFAELETNNNREWFEPQKKRFKALEAEMKQFAADLVEAMNATRQYRPIQALSFVPRRALFQRQNPF